MNNFKIHANQWPVLKQKIHRKYNRLSEEDLAFTPGEERQLVERLARRLKRDETYVLYTLGKELEDLDSNRL